MSNVRDPIHIVHIGFAFGANGSGVVYTAIRGAGEEATACTTFALRAKPALEGRDVAYAALAAVVGELLRRGLRSVEIRLDDARLAEDLAERRGVPQMLVVPYVALRCALNRFGTVRIVAFRNRTIRDLATRALADVSFEIAA